MLKEKLESLFDRVEEVKRTFLIHGSIKLDEGAVGGVKVDIPEYALSGRADTTTAEVLEKLVLERILYDIFGANKREKRIGSVLYWRVLPEFERQEDPLTGSDIIRLRTRLGWYFDDGSHS